MMLGIHITEFNYHSVRELGLFYLFPIEDEEIQEINKHDELSLEVFIEHAKEICSKRKYYTVHVN